MIDPIWRRRMYPEIALFSSKEARLRAWEKAMLSRPMGEMRRSFWRDAIKFALFMILIQVTTRPIWSMLRREMGAAFGKFGDVVAFSIVLIMCLVAWAAFVFLRRGHGSFFQIQRSLRMQLIQAGVPICLSCGYDLRGLSCATCPECGYEFDERLLHTGRVDSASVDS